jgi:O-methyltransferase
MGALTNQGDLRYHIDSATRDDIRGWGIGKNAPAVLELFVNGKFADACVQPVYRSDLGQAFPDLPHADQSGFRVILPTERLNPLAPISFLRLSIRSERQEESVSFTFPSAVDTEPSAGEYWRARLSPFPPPVMAMVESASTHDWRGLTSWSHDAIAEATDVVLFLLKCGSRRASGLFSYFSFLTRIAHAVSFTEKNFPRTTSSRGKDNDAVASSVHEHFLMGHHLLTLKSHGVEGDFVEFGCFKGFSTCCLSFACLLVGARMHVFDSFQGLPASDSAVYEAGEFAGSVEEVKKNVAIFGCPQVLTFHPGFFADVVPKVVLGPIASIWMDVDLESSARDAMKILPWLAPKGCVFSHECWPEHFDEHANIIAGRGPDLVLAPIAEAFTIDNRSPKGRYLAGHTGAIWDDTRSVPPPAPAMVRLYDAMLDW